MKGAAGQFCELFLDALGKDAIVYLLAEELHKFFVRVFELLREYLTDLLRVFESIEITDHYGSGQAVLPLFLLQPR